MLEEEALDLSQAEVNDIQNKEDSSQLGSLGAINRFRQNRNKKLMHSECQRILEVLNKYDP